MQTFWQLNIVIIVSDSDHSRVPLVPDHTYRGVLASMLHIPCRATEWYLAIAKSRRESERLEWGGRCRKFRMRSMNREGIFPVKFKLIPWVRSIGPTSSNRTDFKSKV